ncbi:MAG: hypothetical protein ACE5KX_01615 [Acidimicrobiia bacterium]
MEIPEELARAESVPDDLNSSTVGPYAIPSPRRRRRAATVYAIAGLLAAAAPLVGLPKGLWLAAAGLVALAAFHWVTAWELTVREAAALDVANRAVPFAVGHASATVGFEGWRSRPIWNVLVFSADDPPSQRGLVRVDAVTGRVVESYLEENPDV